MDINQQPLNFCCPVCKCQLEHDASINKEVCPKCKGMYSFEFRANNDGAPKLIVRKWVEVTLAKGIGKEFSVAAYMPQKQNNDKL